MGELRVNIILEKIKQSQKTDVETHVPRVACRETISKKSGAEYTRKKQTGGHGQYGKSRAGNRPSGPGRGPQAAAGGGKRRGLPPLYLLAGKGVTPNHG